MATNSVLVFGLRGNVFRSGDAGKTFVKVDAGLPATIVGTTATATGAILLVDVGGRIAVSDDGGRTFRKVTAANALPVTSIADAGNGRFAMVGPRGAAVTELSLH